MRMKRFFQSIAYLASGVLMSKTIRDFGFYPCGVMAISIGILTFLGSILED